MISEKISKLVSEANQINLKLENLKLENIQQFYLKCKPRQKVDFIKQAFEAMSSKTQTIIFVNTKNFAEILYDLLRKDGYKATIIFGKMERSERDEYIDKFRKGEVQVVITTDLLSRGFDMPTIQLVINFDVPLQDGHPDFETYLHRIGRAGRFGTPGLAVTLFDREEDEASFWSIVEHYKMKDKVQQLDGGAKQLEELLDEIKTSID
jgi:ATP-dependent RNA helicase DDX19/DBP5